VLSSLLCSFSGTRPGAGSLLIEAIWCKNAARMVDLLLSRGVAVDAMDSLGCAALHGASSRGIVSIVRALLEKGAAVNRQCTQGSTALHHAAAFGHAAVVRVLCESGANTLATRDGGFTPLYMACLYGHAAAVTALLDATSEPSSPTEALHMADLQVRATLGRLCTIRSLCE
jgi:ankyrin repeat protein